MSWEIERRGGVLHIRIEAPVGPWSELLDSVAESLSPPPVAILLPARIPGGDDTDAQQIRQLWTVLNAIGMPLQRDDDVST